MDLGPPAVEPGRSPRSRLAVGAEDLLASARLAPSLEDAVADCSWVVALPAAPGFARRPWTPSRSLPRPPAGRGAWPWCSATSAPACCATSSPGATPSPASIPTDARQSSLNLAQAVCVYADALSRGPERPVSRVPRPGNDADFRRLSAELEDVLRSVRPGRAGGSAHGSLAEVRIDPGGG